MSFAESSYVNDILWRKAQELRLLEHIIEICKAEGTTVKEYKSPASVIGNLQLLAEAYPYIKDDLQDAIDVLNQQDAAIDRLRGELKFYVDSSSN